jgi:hypothetical protein
MRRTGVERSRRASEGRVKENSGVKKKILASAKSLLLEFAKQKKTRRREGKSRRRGEMTRTL